MNEQTTTEQVEEAADLVPLGVIAAEIGESVGWVANHFGEAVTIDDVGLRAVDADVARRFFTERAEWKARFVADRERRALERASDRVRVKGAPGRDGLTPFEAMLAAADEYITPDQEFGRGWGSPNS